MSDDGREDGLSDLEAAIERRLNNWAPDGVATAPSAKNAQATRAKSKAKRRKRRRASDSVEQVCTGTQSIIEPAVAEARAREGADAARIALDRALLAPRAERSSASVLTASAAAARANPPERRVVVDTGASPAELLGLEAAGARAGTAGTGSAAGSADAPGSSSAFAFVEKHRREVGDLGATALEKKDKKAFEARRRLEAGLKPLKSQKLPLPMLLGMRKKQRVRAGREKELALASGMLIRSKRKNK